MKSNTPEGPTEAELKAGNVPVEVTHRTGAKEVVDVHLLNVREIQKYAACDGDAAAAAELLARKPKGWADGITLESVFDTVEAGERLNGPAFNQYLKHLNDRRTRMAGVLSGVTASPEPASDL